LSGSSLPLVAVALQAPGLGGAVAAWLLASTAVVLVMTSALGFFCGGLVRSKNILNTLMMSVAALGVVGVVWALAGYSLAFSEGNALIGGTDYFFLRGVGLEGGNFGAFPVL